MNAAFKPGAKTTRRAALPSCHQHLSWEQLPADVSQRTVQVSSRFYTFKLRAGEGPRTGDRAGTMSTRRTQGPGQSPSQPSGGAGTGVRALIAGSGDETTCDTSRRNHKSHPGL